MEESLQDVWTKRIIAFQKSGQTMKAWCTDRQLKVHQLKYWMYRAQKQQKTAPVTATFRAVTVPAPAPADPMWVQVGSARIAVRPGFEPKLLREVVAALTPLC